MSKRIIALLLALVMVFALCACGNGGNGGNSAGGEDVGDETYTIRIACENSDSYPATLGLYQMEKYVESHTNGKVQVEVCASGQLGGEEETLEQARSGQPRDGSCILRTGRILRSRVRSNGHPLRLQFLHRGMDGS